MFFGKDELTPFDPFPWYFKFSLRESMKDISDSNHDPFDIYFKRERIPTLLEFNKFNENKYLLSCDDEMNDNDINILNEFKRDLLNWMTTAISLCDCLSENKITELLKIKSDLEIIMNV